MKILKAFKTELNPNTEQLTLLKKSAGATRWAWNWALRKKKEAFDKYESSGKSSNTIEQHRQLSAIKQGGSYVKGK